VYDVAKEGCVALAINPWQADNEVSSAKVDCQGRTYPLTINGRHATLARISGDAVTLH
jgi:hypothetical protein